MPDELGLSDQISNARKYYKDDQIVEHLSKNPKLGQGIKEALGYKYTPSQILDHLSNKPATTQPAQKSPVEKSSAGQLEQQAIAGFRGASGHLVNTVANAANIVGAKDTARSIRKFGQEQTDKAAQAPEPKGILQEVARDAGGLAPSVVEYAPAMLVKKRAPFVAAAIGALGESDKGWKAAAEGGLQAGVQFKMLDIAAKAPTRLGRALASGAGGAAVTAAFGGNTQQVIAGGMLNAVGGAITPEREDTFKKAAIKVSKEKPSIKESLTRMFAPSTVSPEAKETMAGLRTTLGKLARDGKIAETAFKMEKDAAIASGAVRDAAAYFDKQDVNVDNPGGISDEALNFYHGIQTNDPTLIRKELQPYAEVFSKMRDDRYNKLNERKLLKTYVENWAPQMWNHEEEARQMYSVLGKRQLGGSGSFSKQRVFGNVKEGIEYAKANPDKGLKLVTNNPIEMMWLGLRDQDKTIQMHDFMQQQKNQGLLQYVKPEDRSPAGWSEVPSTVTRVLAGEPGQVPGGKYYMPKDSMDLITNLTSPGAHSSKLASAALYGGSALNKFSLGASAGHLMMTTIEAAISQAAIAAKYAALALQKKDVRMATKAAMQLPKVLYIPFDPYVNVFKETDTGRLAKQYLKPGASPEMERFAKLVSTAGGRVGQEMIYRGVDERAAMRGYYGLKQVAKMAWHGRDNILSINPKYRADLLERMKQVTQATKMGSGLLQIPSALLEKLMSPIFEYTVPMQKLSAYQQMVKFEMDKLGPDATDHELTHAVQTAWDSVDNRLGTFVYDNVGWNNWLKHSMMIMFRSVGWHWGTIREIGGGIKDWGSFFGDLANKRPTEFTHRMAYTMALPVVMGTLNAMTTHLMTGHWPDLTNPENLFSFETGEKDENGKDKRKSFMSYMNDVRHMKPMEGESYKGRVWNYFQGALNPLVEVTTELSKNTNWAGDQIIDPNGKPIEQLEDFAKYAVNQFIPLSVKNLASPSEYRGKDYHPLRDAATNILVIKDVPKDVNLSPYERYANEHMTIPKSSGKDPAQSAKAQLKRDMLKAARYREDGEFDRLFDLGVKRGLYKEGDDRKIKGEATLPPGVVKFSRLSLPDKLFAYQYALKDEKLDPKEKDMLFTILRRSISQNLYKYTMRDDADREKIRVMNQLRILGMLDENGDFNQ